MALCLGTAQFGMDYGIQGSTQPSLSDSIAMLDFAIQNGINAFDTAAAYGTAEDVVGVYLSQNINVRKKIMLVSKLAPDALNVSTSKKYIDVIRTCVSASLKKLKTDYIDVYLLHKSSLVFDDAVIESLRIIKQKGLVNKIGVSVYTPDEAIAGINKELDVIQLPYSVFDQRMGERSVFELASKRSVSLHVRSAFTQGLMLMNAADVPPFLQKIQPFINKLDNLCKQNNISRIQLAIAFVNRQQSVSHLVFGVDRMEQLREIIEASHAEVPGGVLQEAVDLFAHMDENIILPSLWPKKGQ